MSIPARERFKLIGSYPTPLFFIGEVVTDDVRGCVTIVGMTEAPIPWPIGKRRWHKSIVVYRRLTQALRLESSQSICHAWGVAVQTVWKWRKSLGISRYTEGSRRLLSLHALSPEIVAARRKAHAKNQDPERRAKIAASRRGIPRPASVIRKLRRANLGKKVSAETRLKMSESHRKRGTRPPGTGKAWSKAEDALARRLAPIEVAKRTGRTIAAVWQRRRLLGLPDGRAERHKRK